MALFAACVAVVFGALLRDDPRDELRLAVRLFGALVVGAYATGWLMFALFH
jgi:hypothetical protein